MQFLMSDDVSLIQDEAGFRTPQSLLYDLQSVEEIYSGIFDFACPGAAPSGEEACQEVCCQGP